MRRPANRPARSPEASPDASPDAGQDAPGRDGTGGGGTGGGGDPVCPLCLRPIPPDVPQSLHHLVPKLKGGKGGPTVLMHHICHKEVHAALSEAELARAYATPEALRAHPRLARFAAWVAKRPPGFTSQVPGRRGRR